MTATSPYRGLAPFEDSDLDALYFFGRERDTEIVVANLIASRLTVLYGPSGVGKSSLLRAAVAQRLRELPEAPVVVVFDRWGDDPETALAAALAQAADLDLGSLRDVAERAQAVRDVYLILDQTEEYFLYHHVPTGVERELADVVTSPLRVNAVLAVREDALASLDRFLGRMPALYGNVLRLERLDDAGARAAIVRPVGRFSELTGEDLTIEEALVSAVIGEVGAGAIRPGIGGDGATNGQRNGSGIEAPYLQVVMQRVWEAERASGSAALRLHTLERLGGARRIVSDHLERAVAGLTPAQRDLAASAFGHLVTPSGTKIAHAATDLAEYASVSVTALTAVLDLLVENRILRRDELGRYEIFHDVLAAEVLDWRRSHETERAVQRERRAARRRQRRLGLVAGFALLGVALALGLAIWALAERQNAEQQASAARAAEENASQQEAIARQAQKEAQHQAAAASQAQRTAQQEAASAKAAEQEARAARAEAEQNARLAQDAERRAVEQARIARSERDRADAQAAAATDARNRANQQAASATAARRDAEQSAVEAGVARSKAQQAAVAASARERLATARALLAVDPESALAAALDSLELDPDAPAEPVLREGLSRSRVRDVLPGGGGEVVSAIPGADAITVQALRSGRATTPGNDLVTTTRSGVVRVFDAQLGTLRRTIRTEHTVNSAALAPDHRTFAVGGPDGTVRLFSLTSGALVRSLDHVGPVASLSFSGDGRYLASAGANETAKVWDATTGALVHRLAHPRAVRFVTFSPDGTRVLTLSSDRFVRVYDLTTGRLAVRLDQDATPTSATFSPDGARILTTGEDELPHVWDARSGRLVSELAGHTSDVLASAYSPSGALVATAGTDGTARVWEVETGRLVVPLIGHTSFVDAVAFSPDGRRLLTASRDGTARLWNAATGAPQAQFLGHRGRLTSIGFGSDGRWAFTTSDDGTTRTWSTGDEPQLRTIASGPSAVTDIAASTNGELVAESRADGAVSVMTANGRPMLSVELDAPSTSVALTEDGRRLLATDEDGTVAVWAVSTGSRLASFDHGAPVTTGAFVPGGRAILTAGRDGIVRSWNLDTRAGRIVARESAPVADVAVSPDGSLVATAVGNVAHVRPVDGGRVVVLAGHRDAVTSVAFSSDGSRLVTASFDHDAALWDVRRGTREKTLVGHVAVVRGAAFSPDGRWVVTAGPTRAGIWEVGPSTLVDSRLFYLAGHRGALTSVAFVGPGWRVFTGGVDGTVRRYGCRLCAGVDALRQAAAVKLARLDADAKR